MAHDLIGKKVMIRGIADHQGIEVRVGVVAQVTGESVPIGALAVVSIYGISSRDTLPVKVSIPLYQAEPDKYISPAAWLKESIASIRQPTVKETEVGREIIERPRNCR